MCKMKEMKTEVKRMEETNRENCIEKRSPARRPWGMA